MPSKTVPTGKVPKRFLKFQEDYPDVYKAYDQLGKSVQRAGPLSAQTRELVRLAIAIGARHEGAVHSHTRRALEAGVTTEEIRQTVLLSVTSMGFPNMMAAMSWAEDLLEA